MTLAEFFVGAAVTVLVVGVAVLAWQVDRVRLRAAKALRDAADDWDLYALMYRQGSCAKQTAQEFAQHTREAADAFDGGAK